MNDLPGAVGDGGEDEQLLLVPPPLGIRYEL